MDMDLVAFLEKLSRSVTLIPVSLQAPSPSELLPPAKSCAVLCCAAFTPVPTVSKALEVEDSLGALLFPPPLPAPAPLTPQLVSLSLLSPPGTEQGPRPPAPPHTWVLPPRSHATGCSLGAPLPAPAPPSLDPCCVLTRGSQPSPQPGPPGDVLAVHVPGSLQSGQASAGRHLPKRGGQGQGGLHRCCPGTADVHTR